MDGCVNGWMDYVLLLYFSSTNLLPVSFLFSVSGGGNKHDETENRGEKQKTCLQFSERILKCKRNLMFVGGDLFIYFIIFHYFYSYFLFFVQHSALKHSTLPLVFKKKNLPAHCCCILVFKIASSDYSSQCPVLLRDSV